MANVDKPDPKSRSNRGLKKRKRNRRLLFQILLVLVFSSGIGFHLEISKPSGCRDSLPQFTNAVRAR